LQSYNTYTSSKTPALLKKVSLAILPLIPVLLFVINDVSALQPTKLTLSFDKTEYKKSEPVMMDIRLENTGDKPIYVNKRLLINSEERPAGSREISLSVTSPDGKKLPCKVSYETGFPKSDYFVSLKPQESVKLENKRDLRNYFDLTRPGEYKIIATYQNIYGDEIGIDAFKDKVASDPVTIKISE